MNLSAKFFILTCLFASCFSFSQKPYAWINMQYYADFSADFEVMAELNQLEGAVKEVLTFEGNSGIAEKKAKQRAIFNGQGQLIYFSNQFSSDSVCFFFTYNDIGDSVKACHNTWSLDGAEYCDSLFYGLSEKYYLAVYEGYKTVKDSAGNVIEYEYGYVPTYTSFDAYGRKVCDSVPGNGHGIQHVHEYSYFNDHVIVRKRSEYYDYELKFLLDEQGNWIELFQRTNEDEWGVIESRKINYYE